MSALNEACVIVVVTLGKCFLSVFLTVERRFDGFFFAEVYRLVVENAPLNAHVFDSFGLLNYSLLSEKVKQEQVRIP